jgi:hypothetical protein
MSSVFLLQHHPDIRPEKEQLDHKAQLLAQRLNGGNGTWLLHPKRT